MMRHMPPSLSDADLQAVMNAGRPLDRARRRAFLEDVMAEIARQPVVGPGTIHRICVLAQRKYRDVPITVRERAV
jgi:hypothetical protein